MKKIDVLLINDNCDIIKLPESVHNIDDMLRFVNENMDKYVKMFEINHHDCVEPFLIEEYLEFVPVCINFSCCQSFKFDKIYILSKDEYDEKLTKLINEKCHDCAYYEEGDDIDSHRNNMCLDGTCWKYEPRCDE